MSNRLPISNAIELKLSCQTIARDKLANFKPPFRIGTIQNDSIELQSVEMNGEINQLKPVSAFYGENITVDKLVNILSALSSHTTHSNSVNNSIYLLKMEHILGLDIYILNTDLTSRVEELFKSYQIDFVNIHHIIPSLAKPGLIVMDMDSTTIEIECIDEIAKLHGVGAAVSEVTEQAMRGELDFTESLRARVAKLAGADESVLLKVRDTLPIMPGLDLMLQAFYEKGWQVAIASGGFTYFADYLKDKFKLFRVYANQLELRDGQLTGRVNGQIVDAEYKSHVLVNMAHELGLELSQTIAIGDGANDLPMIKKAGLGVAFHAKPSVQAQSKIKINYNDLRSLFVILAISGN
ncbi:phosphoserine phosphatase SerB [Thorsellia anophelis]|uniref:Phosphoserine phosphatase n=1 Tax=Thorsellia anophelis DSM 18579 TaxID=1123402 RepID=A0A1I0A8M3_9GAMM|nr:phosphoserine phosphatase SerB [Thorsellia anophelis]SES90499.1 haloacid dehalogenase-like hydrolase [Thorsellia anophelis DSM 18579]